MERRMESEGGQPEPTLPAETQKGNQVGPTS